MRREIKMANDKGNRNYFNHISTLVFFILIFLYITLSVNPALIYQSQNSLFYFDSTFFKQFTLYPGGLSEYISSFFEQFYIHSWMGGLILTLFLFLIAQLIKRLFIGLNEKISMILFLPPVLSLVYLHSNYDYHLTYTIVICINLAAFSFFKLFNRYYFPLKLFVLLILLPLLYYLTATAFFLFVLLVVLSQFFQKEQNWIEKIVTILFSILLSIAIPILAQRSLFLMPKGSAFIYLLPFSLELVNNTALILFYVYIILVPLYFYIKPFFKILNRENSDKIHSEKKEKRTRLYAAIALLIMTAIVFLNSINSDVKFFLTVDRLSMMAQWDQVIDQMKKRQKFNNRILAIHLNRALYHTNQLCDSIFSFPQLFKEEGLIKTGNDAFDVPIINSDLFFDMGFINGAEQWAYEALSINKETPRILKRLTLVHIAKGEFKVAQKYLELLSKTIFYKKWANRYSALLNDEHTIFLDKELAHIPLTQPQTNFLSRPGFPKADLIELIEKSQVNKMAFEYLICYDLLSCNLTHFMNRLEYMKKLHYPEVPRHFAEVIMLIMTSNPDEKYNIQAVKFQKYIVGRFREFMKILGNYNNDKNAARHELSEKHGDTFWFYFLYNNPREQ